MTDRTFTATELREVLDGNGTAPDKVQALRELILFPPLPTLANMTVKESGECQWLQADVEGRPNRAVLFDPVRTAHTARVMWDDGEITTELTSAVTPRPDLPRLEWPSDQGVEDVPALPAWGELADHPKHGKVIVIDPTPDSDGRIRVMRPIPGRPEYKWFLCEPSELTYTYTDKDTQND